ncbi:hypothetical protein K466DRAFT_451660, partial [Polyporus arcularius HHB13444]
IRAFITSLLQWKPGSPGVSEGVLGVTKAYYGCVEAQGRGTLHCHMVVWVEGGMNPSQLQARIQEGDPDFGRRLVSFMDDILSNHIPDAAETDDRPSAREKPPHPCAIRGLPLDLPPDADSTKQAAQQDLRRLVLKCQVHTHSATCYKYCKDGERKECRFDLDPSNVLPETTVDSETGSISLRRLDGLVNNYNSTILRAMRCNMDIKAIGSGEDAKGIVYYITDYITKTQLKTHITYAALQLAVKKIHSDPRLDPATVDLSVRAKRMLQRCAFSITANQELSAPQVISYLLDFGDQYSSHRFRNVYWPSFERYVQRELAEPDEDGLSDDGREDDDDDIDVDALQPDEVTIGRGADGELVEVGSQLTDYLLRGDALEDITLWDYVSRVDKVSAS